MFGLFKKKASAVVDSPDGPLIAALLLDREDFPIQALRDVLAAGGIDGAVVSELQISKGMLSFKLGDEIIVIAPMPAPFPWKELEGPAHTSWMWPSNMPATSMKSHKRHVLVTMVGGKSARIERRFRLTQLVSLASKQAGVIGIYWPEATLLHYPPIFREMAAATSSPDTPPLFLWVDFRVFANDDGTFGVFTTGMRALGRMEFEIPRMQMPPGELREWATNIACYLLENGERVLDGNTIGMSAEQQIQLKHVAGSFGQKDKVIRLMT